MLLNHPSPHCECCCIVFQYQRAEADQITKPQDLHHPPHRLSGVRHLLRLYHSLHNISEWVGAVHSSYMYLFATFSLHSTFYSLCLTFSSWQDQKSIMVEVAKGGSSQEQLPMVLKVPDFSEMEIATICQPSDNYNLLGFGDILIPGLLVAFVHSFDLQVGTPYHLYYLINVIGEHLIITSW